MNLFKFSLLSFFIAFSIIIPKTSLALDVNQSALVATVNIENARIISQENNTFKIAFSLSNGKGLQTGVKYGVQLISENGKYIADENVYNESLTLYENSKEKKEITYTAPSILGGNYTLVLSSKNESSFPLGTVVLGKVKLTASSKGVQILNESCYLQVEGEKGNPKYTLMQGVDISGPEVLKLTCSATNGADLPMTVIPFFETRYSSEYGNTAKQIGGDYTPVTFKKGEKKTFSILLPKSDAPQLYYLKVALLSSDSSSNVVSMKYIISGTRASIEKLSLDKDSYKAGDNGTISLLWTASSGNFPRSGLENGRAPEVSLNASITGENERECIDPIEQVLVRNTKSPQTIIPFEMKATCMNPKVSVTITDAYGSEVLDQKDFNFKSSPQDNTNPLSTKSVLIIITVLLLILGFGIYMKKKNNSNPSI